MEQKTKINAEDGKQELWQLPWALNF